MTKRFTAPPVTESLENLANNRFLSSMSVEKVKERMEKYPRPTNCTALVTPEVNKEMWKNLGKSVQGEDIKLQHTQRAIVKAGLALMHSTQTLLRAQRGAGEANNREEIRRRFHKTAMRWLCSDTPRTSSPSFEGLALGHHLSRATRGSVLTKFPSQNFCLGTTWLTP